MVTTRKWGRPELAAALELRSDGVKVRDIATALGRTEPAVANMLTAAKKGYVADARPGHWTVEDDRVLLSRGHEPIRFVAADLGRSAKACRARLRRLGAKRVETPRVWTTTDLRKARSMRADRMSFKFIASELGRTVAAVWSALYRSSRGPCQR